MDQEKQTKQESNDLKGLNQLIGDGILGVVDLADHFHQSIYSLGGLLGSAKKTGGITGLIYTAIRKTTQLSIQGVDLALATFKPLLPELTTKQQRNQWVSILNGLTGDHLAASNNPLAIDMALIHQDETINTAQAAELIATQQPQPLLLIHGLCMNDQMWLHKGHDHGQALLANSTTSPFYLRYNSGLSIVENGQKLARLLNRLATLLPSGKKLHILCHSMGGLVMRSALYHGEKQQQTWSKSIDHLVFLGTPHQGAVLEKTGHLLDYLMGISPYSAPFAKLTLKRSQGIKDLRHGQISDDQQTTQLPTHINAFAFAASTQEAGQLLQHKWLGDGLVSIKSALGQHSNPEEALQIKPAHQITVPDVSHMGLLSDPGVFQQLQSIFSLSPNNLKT